ncbi:MAG: hypothetical protein ACM3XM_02320 [Mycobacterium leprae]
MPTYISGSLTLVLIVLLLGFGLQVADIFRTTRAVDAALQFAELEMGMQGCVSSRAINLVKERLSREGLDTSHLKLLYREGPGSNRVQWGGPVELDIHYEEPRQLLGSLTTKSFNLVVDRHIATISGWVTQGDAVCR